jgi:hypothetical protein
MWLLGTRSSTENVSNTAATTSLGRASRLPKPGPSVRNGELEYQGAEREEAENGSGEASHGEQAGRELDRELQVERLGRDST